MEPNTDWKSRWKLFFAYCRHWLLRPEPSTSGCLSRMPANADSYAACETVDGHQHIWIYRREFTQEIKRVVCRQAADPAHTLDWFDAQEISQSMTDIESHFELQKINQFLNVEADAIRLRNLIE